MRYELHLGDNREILRSMPSDSVDSIVSDPPYELGFMGKRWDSTGIAYDVTLWTECLRVLKPGGHLLAFGGSRTYHRLAVAIEDVGFEIRDCIMWLYGSGFPKSHDVSKALDKQAGAEREVVGIEDPHYDNCTRQNQKILTHAFDIGRPNALRTITAPATPLAQQWQGWGTALKPAHEPIVVARKPLQGTVADNVTAWGVGALNIDRCRVEASIDDIEAQRKRTGGVMGANIKNNVFPDGWKRKPAGNQAGRWPANIILDEEAAHMLDEQSGGASRFFYVAKASKTEREAGLEASDKYRANHHPTVKPIALMRYLVRMVTPRGGVVLDPFMGSGTTGCAAMLEAVRFIGIDITPEYVDIADRRIQHWASQNPMEL